MRFTDVCQNDDCISLENYRRRAARGSAKMVSVEPENTETGLVLIARSLALIARIVIISVLITVAAWLLGNVVLDWFGAPRIK